MTKLQVKKIRSWIIGATIFGYISLIIGGIYVYDTFGMAWLINLCMVPILIGLIFLVICGTLSSLAHSIIDWRARGIFTEEEYKLWRDINVSYLIEKTYPLEMWVDWVDLCDNAKHLPYWIRNKFDKTMDMSNLYYSTWQKSQKIKYPKFWQKMIDMGINI